MSELPASWRDHRDEPVDAPPVPPPGAAPFYLPMMELQGASYERNAFARGTSAEAAALTARLGLRAGTRILDVGCGNGRHLRALAADPGCVGVGLDIAPSLVAAARGACRDAAIDGLRFEVADARALQGVVEPGSFDVAWSLCHGGFGTSPVTDAAVLRGLADAVRPGGHVVVTAFHALFAARHLVEGDAYDVVHGVHHHRPEVRGPDDAREHHDLWTVAYTVGEVVRACGDAGLTVTEVVGCEPGRYDAAGVGLDDPELLVVARR